MICEIVAEFLKDFLRILYYFCGINICLEIYRFLKRFRGSCLRLL